MILAMTRDGVIGKNNSLPWILKNDLKRFKEKTSNHSVIMGRKTYDSLEKALSNRNNIVLTKNDNLTLNDAFVCHSLADALKLCSSGEVFIIGGATLFNRFMKICDKIYLTIVEASIEGDTRVFIDFNDWEISDVEKHFADEYNEFDYTFMTLTRKHH